VLDGLYKALHAGGAAFRGPARRAGAAAGGRRRGHRAGVGRRVAGAAQRRCSGVARTPLTRTSSTQQDAALVIVCHTAALAGHISRRSVAHITCQCLLCRPVHGSPQLTLYRRLCSRIPSSSSCCCIAAGARRGGRGGTGAVRCGGCRRGGSRWGRQPGRIRGAARGVAAAGGASRGADAAGGGAGRNAGALRSFAASHEKARRVCSAHFARGRKLTYRFHEGCACLVVMVL